ncbi:hypothetical protein POM88_018580 [Heracleum sosnowskyi]|uniref:Uncharacterized protein n=1 Tax=Heracleum sosnowskyi TaxID=360622 RepID=A0AAD8IU05_9APIA|nr:hypothetical protein POM88_018580 [Heracleum sosnowskyi]
MRGRLRGVFDADNLLNAEKLKSEDGSSEGGKNIVIDYGLPDDKEYPDYEDLVQCNYKLARLYATSNSPTSDDEAWDFSFTQMAIDQRIERIEDIRVEIEGIANDEATEDDDEKKKQASMVTVPTWTPVKVIVPPLKK